MGVSEERQDSSGEVQRLVFDRCKELIDSREETYGSHWRTEDPAYLDVNIRRKYLGFDHQVVNRKKVQMEDLLDLINYTAFRYIKEMMVKGEYK
jgi:hypothetical protein